MFTPPPPPSFFNKICFDYLQTRFSSTSAPTSSLKDSENSLSDFSQEESQAGNIVYHIYIINYMLYMMYGNDLGVKF